MRADRPQLAFDKPDVPEEGFERIRITPEGSGYRGYPRGAEVDLYHTEAAKVVDRGYGTRVAMAQAVEPEKPAEPEKKELDAPPADKSMKRSPVKTK